MEKLSADISFYELKERLGQKINKHIVGLDRTKKQDNQKILELCHIGKFLATYYPTFEILHVQEKPDFLISDGQSLVGLEHEAILDTQSKEKEGFYQNICDKVEAKLKEDLELPNFLVTLYIKENASLKIKDKSLIVEKLSELVKTFLLTNELEQNDFVRKAVKMRHSGKSVQANFGAYIQKCLTPKLLSEFIAKKEAKIDVYKQNSVSSQWLVLLIGSNGESSFEVSIPFKMNIESKFDKIFLYEDFGNQLFIVK